MLLRYLTALLLIIFLQSCKEEIQGSKTEIILLACSESEKINALQARSIMVGEWRWMYLSCENSRLEPSQEPYRGLTVLIKENGEIEFSQDGVVTLEAVWNIVDEGEKLFLSTTPRTPPIVGDIVFCNDWFSATGGQNKNCRHNFLRNQ